jgi:hypothetical protein
MGGNAGPMTAPSEEAASRSVGGAARRLLLSGLRDGQPSVPMALLLAGLVVLLAAWALVSPPVLLSKAMTQDLLFNLAGAWQVYLGQVPHVDFHDPTGQLSFLLTALGFHFFGPSPFAFLMNVIVVTALLFAASALVAIRRLPMLPAVLFIVFVCLLALMPANIGDRPEQYTFAMSYNRYGWAAYSVLALIVFVPPQIGQRSIAVDLAVAGGLLAMMFYLKITYFAAGLATVGFAVILHPHVYRRRGAWALLCLVLAGHAFAPWNRAYLGDILAWSASGAVRTGLAVHLNNFIAALGQYTAYLAAIFVGVWLWWYGRSAARFPLTLALLFVVSLLLLTQNSQAVGLPSGIVMLLILYNELRGHFTWAHNRDIGLLLVTLLIFPFFEAGRLAATLYGYNAQAKAETGLHVVQATNLGGLAVPAGGRGAFLEFSQYFDYPVRSDTLAAAPHYQLTDYEYVLVLIEAAGLLADRTPGGIALFDSVNPLPYMLGWEPSRGANLWSTWNAPVRPPSHYLAQVRYVLIPKFPLNPPWTDDLLHLYGPYLEDNFQKTPGSRCWTLLIRRPPNATADKRQAY